MSFRNRNATLSLLAAGLLLSCFAGCRSSSPRKTSGAGGPPSALAFREVAAAAGLRYRWQIPGPRPLNILQEVGNGCAFLDWNNDGKLDILLVGEQVALFEGNGGGQFIDVSAKAGIASLKGHFLGCCVGDYDNDGWDDLYLSGYRTGVLLHNEAGRSFRNASAGSGIPPQPWGTSCAFADLDGDGRLDLFIANYARFGPEPGIPQLCESHGFKTACAPRYYKPLKPTLFLNRGAGRFTEASQTAGLSTASGRGLGVAVAPLERLDRPYIAVANDELPGDLFAPSSPSGTLRYRNVAATAGTSVDRDGHEQGGMGTDWGDYDNDGRLDLLVATYQNEPKSLYHNQGQGVFTDVSYPARVTGPLFPRVSFGCKFLDADNDGWLDLVVASGHIQDDIDKIDPSTTYRQPTALLRNRGGASPSFEDVSGASGPFFTQPIVGRGLALGDYDNDGREDLLIVDSEGAPALLHNETATPGHWLSVSLTGVRSNRDGIGALVTAEAAGRKLTRLCHTDGSYLSASDRRVHFGLGQAATVDSLTVRWPSGRVDTLRNLRADQFLGLREGGKAAEARGLRSGAGG